jgi:hypothetical protein
LSLLAAFLTLQGKMTPPSATVVIDFTGLFMEQVFEDILSNDAVARTATEANSEAEEGQQLEEEDE